MQSRQALDVSLRNASGMHYARRAGANHWAGWLALLAGSWSLLFGEYHMRTSGPMGFYLVEGWLALCMPFFAMYIADSIAVNLYHSTYREVQRMNLAERVLDQVAIEDIRSELAGNLLLRAFRPPRSLHIAAQLYSAALWYRAIVRPAGAGFWQRYSEQATDMLLGYIPLFLAAFVAVSWMESGARWQMALTALLAGLSLVVLGLSLLRFAARRQAILDYFAAWRTEAEPAS
jgi:hypothetical protein